MRGLGGVWLKRAVAAAIASAGLLFVWGLERGSVERANRLHRDGALAEAAEIYQVRADVEDAGPAIRYNLGTSLLELEDPGAAAELADAAEATDEVVRARAHYNTGLWSLRQALGGSTPDSARIYAAAAVVANRSSLRLRPGDPDTQWNLAIAQRLLDSIDTAERRSGDESEEGAVEAEEVERSQNTTDVEEENEMPEDAPRDGEEEALADADDEAPLSAIEAADILGQSHLDATLIIGKLLALESRSFWGRRVRRGPGPRR